MAPSREGAVILIEIICAFLGVSGSIMLKFNNKLSSAYMDELFHIPQAQKYCKGIFNEVGMVNVTETVDYYSHYRSSGVASSSPTLSMVIGNLGYFVHPTLPSLSKSKEIPKPVSPCHDHDGPWAWPMIMMMG